MIIDTTSRTVLFDKPISMGVEQLNALIAVLEGGVEFAGYADWERDLLQSSWHPCTPDEALAALRDKLAGPKPVSTKTITSFTDPYVEYTLSVFGDGHVECSCPHFQIRGFANGTLLKDFRCKHIRVYFPGV